MRGKSREKGEKENKEREEDLYCDGHLVLVDGRVRERGRWRKGEKNQEAE